MGLIIDTDVWVLAEKSARTRNTSQSAAQGSFLNLARWAHHGAAYMSAVTASELLVGVERANSAQRRAQRAAFVEHLLGAIPVLDFSMAVARTHARMLAALPKNVTASAHDALIAATAIHYGFALLTRNVKDFKPFAGLELESYEIAV